MTTHPTHLARPARLKGTPCDRLDGVVLGILKDAAHYDFHRHLKYSVPAVIEKVVFRRQSVASCGSAPSYLWMTLDLDEDGVPYPDIDLGSMPHEVLCPPPIHKWGALKGQPDTTRRRWRISMPRHEHMELGSWALLEDGVKPHDFVLTSAIPIGTMFLTRVSILYSTSYEGEVDCDIETDILFIDSAPERAYLPIPVSDDLAAAIGARPRGATQWSIA